MVPEGVLKVSNHELLTTSELARVLRVTPETIREWAKDGRIPAMRIRPKVLRFNLLDVKRAMVVESDPEGSK